MRGSDERPSAAPGNAIGVARREPWRGPPDANASALFEHDHQIATGGTALRREDFENHGIAQRAIRRIEIALTHDPFSHLPRVARAVRRQMAHAGVCDLALLEEAMADNVANASMLTAFEQPDRGAYVRQVATRLRNLSLIGGDGAGNARFCASICRINGPDMASDHPNRRLSRDEDIGALAP